MTYDALNHPDEEYLKSIYPEDVIKNMPEWIRKYWSSKESKRVCELYVDTILSDDMLLLRFMYRMVMKVKITPWMNGWPRMKKVILKNS